MKLSIVASITLGGLCLKNAFGAPLGDLQEFFAAIPDLHINVCYTYNGSQQCVEPTIVKLLDRESQNSFDCILEIPMSGPHLKQLMENMPSKDLMARIPRHFSLFYGMTGHLFKNLKYSSAVRIFATMLGSAAITWSILFVADDKTHQSTQTNQSTQNTLDSSDNPSQPMESLPIKVPNNSFNSRDLSPFFFNPPEVSLACCRCYYQRRGSSESRPDRFQAAPAGILCSSRATYGSVEPFGPLRPACRGKAVAAAAREPRPT